jgi:pimeloyl-ACP methyl ester carboxylesterase
MNKEVKFDASRLTAAIGGAGEPAVFVHGLASNRLIWRRVCHGLKDDFSYHAIDLPGSGESPAPRHFQYTIEHFADVLTDFIILKDLKRLTLVGASLGAAVILVALLRNRDELAPRVRALCLIDAIAYPQDFPFFVEILRTPLIGPLALTFPFFAQIPRRRVGEALIRTARSLNAKHLSRYVQRLDTILLPTLVIWGRKDGVVPLRAGKRLARDLPNSHLIVINHCGHSPHTECPAKVISALKEFAQKTSGNVSLPNHPATS